MIGIARQKYVVNERTVEMDEISGMRECFLTSSTKGVLPIIQVGDQVIADGRPGPVTMDLHEAFKEHVRDYITAHHMPAS